MKFYITQWALTRGIEEAEGELTDHGRHVTGRLNGYLFDVPVRDAHKTRQAAVLRHREMVRGAIKNANAKIAKMKKIEAALDRELDEFCLLEKRADCMRDLS